MLIAPPNDVIVAGTGPAPEDFFSAGLSRLRSLGDSRSRLAPDGIRMPNATTALHSAVFVRLKTDGSELERSAATYLFRNEAGTWQIFALLATDPDKAL